MRFSICIADVVPSAELICLCAIEEESPEPAQDDCPLSPFGLRQGLPPNPEERYYMMQKYIYKHSKIVTG